MRESVQLEASEMPMENIILRELGWLFDWWKRKCNEIAHDSETWVCLLRLLLFDNLVSI